MISIEHEDGVIIITQDGEEIVCNRDDINTHHWSCFSEIENKLNLDSNGGNDAMEHAWYLARKGIISFQVVKNQPNLIVSPEVDMVSPVQFEKMHEVVKNFSDEDEFGVELVSNNEHRPIIINGSDVFGFDELNEIFHLDDLEKHKTR